MTPTPPSLVPLKFLNAPKDTDVPVTLEKHSKRRCRGRVADSGPM